MQGGREAGRQGVRRKMVGGRTKRGGAEVEVNSCLHACPCGYADYSARARL